MAERWIGSETGRSIWGHPLQPLGLGLISLGVAVALLACACGQGEDGKADAKLDPDLILQVACAANSDLALGVKPSEMGMEPGEAWFPAAIEEFAARVAEAWWHSRFDSVKVIRAGWTARVAAADTSRRSTEVAVARVQEIAHERSLIVQDGEVEERIVDVLVLVDLAGQVRHSRGSP